MRDKFIRKTNMSQSPYVKKVKVKLTFVANNNTKSP